MLVITIGVGQMLLVLFVHVGQTVLTVIECIVVIVIPGVVHPAVADTVVLAVYVTVASTVPALVAVEICLFGRVVLVLQLFNLLPQ